MKFDICVGNPPYQGKGDPLYMQITKAAYDTVLDKDGVMCMINPTTMVDNKLVTEQSKILIEKYKGLKLLDFMYNKDIRGSFTSVNIGNDIAIFIYGKNGRYTLFDDWTRSIRFGEDYYKDKDIVDLIHSKMDKSIRDYKFIHFEPRSHSKAKELVKKYPINRDYVCMSYIRGNVETKTGGHKWDWTTLMNSVQLVVQEELPETAFSAIDFNEDRSNAVELIKWVNTDFIMFIVDYYKFSTANQPVIFKHLPQPPTSGDYSDESICEAFGLEMSDMEYIHKKMKNYGWKTKRNVDFISNYNKVGFKLPSVKLDGTDKTLLKFIEELNRINDGVETSSYVPEYEEENEEYSEIEYVDPDSSTSGSLSSKTVLDN